jgi:hypothetical protein
MGSTSVGPIFCALQNGECFETKRNEMFCNLWFVGANILVFSVLIGCLGEVEWVLC